MVALAIALEAVALAIALEAVALAIALAVAFYNKVDNMDNLKITTNSLFDIIQYLKDGNMVCLHTRNNYIYFHFPDSINEKLIYIDISSMPSLMDEEEWPWYIINSGFVKYESILNLPINQTFYRI